MLVTARVLATAAVVVGLLYLMLDSGLVSPGRAPALTSLSLGGLAMLFGIGAWATAVGGDRAKSPLLVGLALGLGGYALARVVLF